MERIESVILRNLVFREEYMRKVLPFIEPEYFNAREERIIFEQIAKYAADYDNLVTQEILSIEIENRNDITEEESVNINKIINSLENVDADFDWLSDTTEKWCRDRAIYLALMESIGIANDEDQKKPEMLSQTFSQKPWRFLSTVMLDTTT